MEGMFSSAAAFNQPLGIGIQVQLLICLECLGLQVLLIKT
jgi:hypothetical protein